MPFVYFDHTGDIGVDLSASSLPVLFEEAAVAFTAVMCDPARVEPRQRDPVALAAGAADLLMVDWLQELLYLFEVRRLLVRRAHVTVTPDGSQLRLDAVLEGEPVDPERHPIAVLVKAVTYHGLKVAQDEEGWKARIILDI